MSRLFITADVHGSLGTWMTLQALMEEGDQLVVAGDLFDTRYGSYGNPDFQPDTIRSEVKAMARPFHYVYGNCDVEGYYPGQESTRSFSFQGREIFLHHGHRPVQIPESADLVIQGHTHLPVLDRQQGRIFLNPGSMIRPRNQVPSYAVATADRISILKLKTGAPLATLDWDING